MNYWLILTPVVAALTGWLFAFIFTKLLFHPGNRGNWLGLSMQGLILKRQADMSARVAKLITLEFNLAEVIEQKVLDPAILEKITPEIEKHIDYFLRVKLKDAMPMVAMFVGDKTITQMKEVFMTEMATLFPEIMKNYVNEMQNSQDIIPAITHKLATIPSSKIELFIHQTFKKELRYVQLAGAVLGLIIGIIQAICFLLIFF